MKIQILHLSDLHIKNNDEAWLKDRVDVLLKAIKSTFFDSNFLIIAISGDIAFSGTGEEYKLIINFLNETQTKLKELNIDTVIYTVPGNHDCLFNKESTVRDLVLKGVLENSDSIKEDVIEICTQVQKNYFDFSLEVEGKTVNSKIAWSNILNLGDKRIVFNCFNTAWMSKLNEDYGGIVMPEFSDAQLEKGNLVVSMFHHPHNWQQQKSLHRFKEFVEKTSDLIISGHEHNLNHKHQADNINENLVLANGAFKDEYSNSVFSIIEIDLESSNVIAKNFHFTQNLSEKESKKFKLLKLKEIQRSKYKLQPSMIQFLDELTLILTHHKKDKLFVQDIFVWPSLKRERGDDENSVVVDGSNVYLESFKGKGTRWIFF